MSREALAAQVCPENARACDAIAAQFDPESYRILLRDALDLNDPQGQNFLLHELMHVLQYRQQGADLFAGGVSGAKPLSREAGQDNRMNANGVDRTQ
ncbi:MAG: hypothetical protein KF778_22835 [Rhodocyclaceae bacterium]|nr:hypothetical protein [Rhodocyclaceae bacterium]MBX3671243.1 hypothetical protein [Rhodocyclaceae bacterium]